MTDRPPPATTSTETTTPAGPNLVRAAMVGAVVVALVVLFGAVALRDAEPSTSHYLALSMLLFVTGALGVLMRRNALVLFMCVEIMLNAVNIAFVAFARLHSAVEGHVIVLFVMIVAAAEVAVGLAIIVSIFRRRQSANVDDMSLLRW